MEKVQLILNVPEDFRKNLKIVAALHGITMTRAIEEAVLEKFAAEWPEDEEK